MQVVDIPLERLHGALWNPNIMNHSMMDRLRKSVHSYGLVENLVVRPIGDAKYEVLGGNHRLSVLREMRVDPVPCVVVDLDDSNAKLLSQALNHIEGEDNPGLRAALLRDLLQSIPQEEVLALLPETAQTLESLASLGTEEMVAHIQKWQETRSARLKHFTAQLTGPQMEIVEEALERLLVTVEVGYEENPNRRGIALYLLCLAYLEQEGRRK